MLGGNSLHNLPVTRKADQHLGDSGSGADLYRKLKGFADRRRRELTTQLQPVLDLADAYGALIARAVVALSSTPPKSRHDTVVRDLIADVFDFLYEWPRPLFEGRLHVAFPLARRAYESLSLLSACYQDPSVAERWDRGEEISNAEIRRALAKLPFPESEQAMKDLYKFFSKGTHPNRDLISERFLGDGNDFVLGSIGQPELVLIVDHCHRLVEMWFWFGALVGYVAKEILVRTDPAFGKDYQATAARAQEIAKWLIKSFSKLLDQRQKEMRAERRS